jgi:hypothetical protein
MVAQEVNSKAGRNSKWMVFIWLSVQIEAAELRGRVGHADSSSMPNHSMKPTTPDRMIASVFATGSCRGLSLSR